jgi:glycosyltransferase involved in cell wall biosynthesis
MPVRQYGIFLAYGPTVDLRKEGLGRLLTAFLKAAAAREDVRFVIVCPQWSRRTLVALCDSEGIPPAAFDVVTTSGVPFMVRLYLAYVERLRRPPRPSRLMRLLSRARRASARHLRAIERSIVAARNPFSWLAVTLYAVILGFVLFVLGGVAFGLRAIIRLLTWTGRKVRPIHNAGMAVGKVLSMVHDPGEEKLEDRLYRMLEEVETDRMRKLIDGLENIKAWFCPTSFWPAFNKISRPGLLCVPDVVPVEFPGGFAKEPALLKSFEIVERSIRGGHNFVTYSARTKWKTLVDRYAVKPENVAVIPHACWDLSPSIKVTGFSDEEHATREYCESLLQQALRRSGTDHYVRSLDSGSLRFLFYASQFRPNKNLVMLVRAYEHLLRERFIQQKLMLTGDPNRYTPLRDYVRTHGLGRDVLFLHGLTTPELAACYYLADLAVNPSLSEGGCPFTLTEALSVNTPVVMARIPVTEEVVVDPALQEMMLFDPYDYLDASARIEWALHHRESLLAVQRVAYTQLGQRTWRNVVDDYVTILDGLSGQ